MLSSPPKHISKDFPPIWANIVQTIMLSDTYRGSVSHKRKCQQNKVYSYDNDTTNEKFYNAKKLSYSDCGHAL